MKLLLLLIAASASFGQSTQDSIRVRRVYDIRSQAVIDNRSETTARMNMHTFQCTGVGTWSCQLQYSDSSVSGPWSNYSEASSLVDNLSPNSNGSGFGYHAYIRVATTGTITRVDYAGMKDIYLNRNSQSLVSNVDWITQVGNKPVIDAREYGADPSGVVDSTAAIQAAVTASIASTSGKVYLPRGTYKVSSKVTVCSSWKYASIEGESTDSTVIAPTSAFPEITTDSASAVFNSDCGSLSQPNASNGPQFRNFKIIFPQPQAALDANTKTGMKQWTGFNLNNTLNVVMENVIVAKAWRGITWKGTWSGSAWTAVVGRGTFSNVGIGAYDIHVEIDGMTDSSRFNGVHLWPFETFSLPIFFPSTIGFKLGRVDDLSINSSLCMIGKCMQFVAGADGNGGFTKVNGHGFDTYWAIDMPNSGFTGSAQHSVVISNSTFSHYPAAIAPTTSASDYYLIRLNRGSLSIVGGYISGVGYTNPMVYIDNTSTNVTTDVNFSAVGIVSNGVGDVPMIQQANNVATTNLSVAFKNCSFFNYAATTYTAPMVDFKQTNTGARLIFTGNTWPTLNTGNVGTAVAIASDNFHNVTGNTFNYVSATQGWVNTYPATKTLGLYQDTAGAWINPRFQMGADGDVVKISGITPILDFAEYSGSTLTGHGQVSYKTGEMFFDLFAAGNWKFRGASYSPVFELQTTGLAKFYGPASVSGTAAVWASGTGSPENAVTAPVGSLYTRTDGGSNTTLYIKESGSGNTGWIAK